MAFPSTLIQLTGGSSTGFGTWWSRYMYSTSPWYLLVTALLIFAFTFFYTSISFNPDDIAKNIQQQGGAIPSVRPGKPTADYLKRINNRLTLFAGIFLAILATIPSMFARGTSQSLPFGASSLLIAVSVILETKRQMDDLLINRNYEKIS
jgi:preprotein translocase subunit SecY